MRQCSRHLRVLQGSTDDFLHESEIVSAAVQATRVWGLCPSQPNLVLGDTEIGVLFVSARCAFFSAIIALMPLLLGVHHSARNRNF